MKWIANCSHLETNPEQDFVFFEYRIPPLMMCEDGKQVVVNAYICCLPCGEKCYENEPDLVGASGFELEDEKYEILASGGGANKAPVN